MQINCPSCGEGVLVVEQDAGKKIECPFCSQSFRMEAEKPEPPASTQVDKKSRAWSVSEGERIYLEWPQIKVTDKRVLLKKPYIAYGHFWKQGLLEL